MDDALHAVDLDRRPVALHGGDLAAGDAPQQTGAVQVIQRARWMTSKRGQRIPAAAAMYGLVEVRCRRGTSARPSMALASIPLAAKMTAGHAWCST